MYRKMCIIVLFGLMTFLQGCNTIKSGSKGIAEGFKEDWKIWQERDGWLQENLW